MEHQFPTFAMSIGGLKVVTPNTFNVTNPANGKIVGAVPNARKTDLDAAVEAADRAFQTWSQTPDDQLRAACLAVAEKIEDHSDEIAQLLTQEQGKPYNARGSRREVAGAVAWAKYTANLSLPMQVLQDNNVGRIEMYRKPLGVVGSITPWNFPVMIAVWHMLPALRTGNTIVIKPSPLTPIATIRLVELMNEVLPAGVVNIVTSDDKSENIGAAMSTHPKIRKMVFTGSTATGKRVMAGAAETMKRLTLELGGNDAGIVLPDVDAKQIAEALFWGAFNNNGQTCAAMKRLYVHDDVYEEVCEALVDYARTVTVGDGAEGQFDLGPINNQMQFDKVKHLVDAAKAKGKVLLGGEAGEGLFFPPTLIADLEADDALVAEEQFGPVLPIIRYTDIDDAIAQANNSENGLGGSVWSQDIEAAKKIASRLECGSVWINRHGAIQPNAPFGGRKSSGFGVEFGEEGLAEYTDIQVVYC